MELRIYVDMDVILETEFSEQEIANMINRSLRTVKTRMNEMQEKGLIARKNGKRNGEWIIL